jgi:hypothetical protein
VHAANPGQLRRKEAHTNEPSGALEWVCSLIESQVLPFLFSNCTVIVKAGVSNG